MENYKYPEDWLYEVVGSDSNSKIIRANLTCEDHSLSWVKSFGNLNQAEWIGNRTYISNNRNQTPKRYISHRRWVCQHNNRNKQSNSSKATGCSMAIDIKIKLVTTKTKQTDSYMKLKPPLQAVIKIEGTHNHPTNTPESLRFLPISDKTKAQFKEYFKNGLGPIDAIKYHETKLLESGATVSDFADCSKNPTLRMVRNVYDNYRNQTSENLVDPLENLIEQQTCEELDTMDKSSVWQYFNQAKNAQSGKCKKCGQIINSAGGSTSDLHTHLKSQHKINLLKRKLSVETVTSTSSDLHTKSKITHFIKTVDETLPAVISRMVAKDGIHFNTFCTSYDLRKLFNLKGFTDIPRSPNSIRKIVLEYGTKIHNLLMDEFSTMTDRVFSVTMDEWTSLRNRRYINVNLHFRNQYWNLGLIPMNASMSAEKPTECLQDKLAQFNIKLDDIFSMTTDGASLIKKTGKLSGILHLLCLARGLQLAVINVLYKKISKSSYAGENISDLLSDISSDEEDEEYNGGLQVIQESTVPDSIRHHELNLLICKVRSIVNLYKKSSLNNDNLQKHVKDEFGKELTLYRDCKTRWDSLLKMLERFYEVKNAILKSLTDIKSTININNSELGKILEIILALQPVKVAAEALCHKDVNLSTADLTIKFMLYELSKYNSLIAVELKEQLIMHIKERRTVYSDVVNYLYDPNIINGYDEYEIFNTTSKATIKAKIIDIVKHEFSKNENYKIFEQKDKEDEMEIIEILTLDEKLKLAIKTSNLKSKEQKKIYKDINSVIQKEMLHFELEKNRGKYLNVALQYLMTCRPSSIESERAFSSAGQICTKFRSSLNDDCINSICFMRAFFINSEKMYQKKF